MSRPHKTVNVVRVAEPDKEFTKARNALLDDKAVHPAARFVLIWLLRHDEQFHTSVARIAKGVGLNRETAEKYCKALEEAGYLDRSGTTWRVTDKRGEVAGKTSILRQSVQESSNQDAGKSSNVASKKPATKKTKEDQQEDQPPLRERYEDKKTKASPLVLGDAPGDGGTSDTIEPPAKYLARFDRLASRPSTYELPPERKAELHRKIQEELARKARETPPQPPVPDTPVPSVPDTQCAAEPSEAAPGKPPRIIDVHLPNVIVLSPCDNHGDQTGRVDNRSGSRLCEACAPWLWRAA